MPLCCWVRASLAALTLLTAACASAQRTDTTTSLPLPPTSEAPNGAARESGSSASRFVLPPAVKTFRSRADSLQWERARTSAARAAGYRVVVSLFDRRLWVISGSDTLLHAPVAVGSGSTLDYAGRSWTFRTPRGRHTVLRKVEEPVWRPPEWLYAEVAREYGLKLRQLPAGSSVRLKSGSRLTTRDSLVGIIEPGSRTFHPLPVEEHIVFDGTLFIPPFGTKNRLITGELGHFALDLGDGYLLHGTRDPKSIGRAITHGCIRLADPDIQWLYDNVRVGTPVFVY